MNQVESSRRFNVPLLLIVAVAAWLRLAGISIEPFWLDEVFTSYLSSGSLEDVVIANARDTHPPLYFLGVATVRQIFGNSEVAIRSFSTVLSLLGILLVMLFARDLGGNRVSIMAGMLAAVNPLDLYCAQEARMYSQAAVLATASSWFLWRWISQKENDGCANSRWGLWPGLYWGASVLLCLTHLVGTLVLLAQGIFALIYFLAQRRYRQALALTVIGSSCVAAVAVWASYVIEVRGEFFSGAILGWIPPQTLFSGFRFLVDQFFLAFCGGITADVRRYLSLVAWMLVFFVLGSCVVHSSRYFVGRFTRLEKTALDLDRIFLLWMTIGPVLVALLASRLFHPIYYPPRFSPLVLAPFLILTALEINNLRSKTREALVFCVIFMVMAVGSWCQTVTITKKGMAEFAEFWSNAGPPDVAVFSPGHNRVMASYYTGQTIPPTTQSMIEKRLKSGEALTLWICSTAGAATMENRDTTLAGWVSGLGANRRLGVFDDVTVTEVSADGLPKVYPPLPGSNQITFAEESADGFLWYGWYQGAKEHRWSRGNQAEVSFSLPKPREFSRMTLQMVCFGKQRIDVLINDNPIDSFVCQSRTPHRHEIAIPPGSFGSENTLTFLLPDAIAPNKVSTSRDTRELALGIQWIRFEE